MFIHAFIPTLIFLLFSATNAAADQDLNFCDSSTKTTSPTGRTISATGRIMKITKNTDCSARPTKGAIGHFKKSIQHDMDAREAIQNIMPSYNK